jgi:hypothetical protein
MSVVPYGQQLPPGFRRVNAQSIDVHVKTWPHLHRISDRPLRCLLLQARD